MTTESWHKVRLGDLVNIKHGWAFKGEFFEEYSPGKPIVVNIGNFKYTGGFRFESTTLKAYTAVYPEEYILEPGDILLVMTCQTAGGEILGIPGRIPNDGRTYLHNQRMGKPIITAPSRIDKDFLYWLFLSPDFNRELFLSASGTKILHTAPNRIEAFQFLLPPIAEQKAIAHILGTLDDKIELNQQMNQTLEAIARALFKSWFIDFDPVRAKLDGRQPIGMDAETAALFPAEFEDSALGKIPKGWKASSISEIANVTRGASPRPIHDYMGGTVPWIKIADATSAKGCFIFETKETIKSEGVSKSVSVYPGDLILSNSATCGVPMFVQVEGCIHDGWLLFRNLKGVSKGYLFHHLSVISEMLIHLADGSVQKNLNTKLVGTQSIVLPSEEILKSFDCMNDGIFEKIRLNILQTHHLTSIRDALLPKLLSGEIRVQDAETVVEAVT